MAITLSWLREAKSGLRKVWQSESFCTLLKPKEIYNKTMLVSAIYKNIKKRIKAGF